MPEHTPGPTLTRGVYGLAMHIIFELFFFAYILWALIPEKWFIAMGITYLPQRYWAVAVPIFVLTVVALFAFVIYPSLGLLMTPDIDSLETITDSSARYSNHNEGTFADNATRRKIPCICRKQTFCMKHMYDSMEERERRSNAIPDVHDLRIEDVSKDLYL